MGKSGDDTAPRTRTEDKLDKHRRLVKQLKTRLRELQVELKDDLGG